MPTKADTVFYGGHIFTMEGTIEAKGSPISPRVDAVAIADGVIIAAGPLEEVSKHVKSGTQLIYLNGQTLMPGFIECHQHACFCAVVRSAAINISAMNYQSYAQIYDVMKARMDAVKPGEWGLFFAWDPELIPDLPNLSATFLDENFSATSPMFVIGQSGHVGWANHPAMKIAGIDANTPDPDGGTIVRDEDGNPTGQFFEEPAMGLIMAHASVPDSQEILQGFKDQWRHYASVGITTATDLGYIPADATDDILRYLADGDDCPVRIALYRLEHAITYEDKRVRKPVTPPRCDCCPAIFGPVPKIVKSKKPGARSIGYHSDRLWEAGIKLIADGSPHCGTAAVREPFMYTPLSDTLGFPEAPTYGILNMEFEPFVSTVKHFHQEGTQIAIHTHGERASEQAIRAYEQVLGEAGAGDRRHRMEHCGLTTVEQIQRAGKLNLSFSFFVDHLRYYGKVYKTDIFGDRVNRWTPLSEATKAGMTWTIHQDHPTFPGDAAPFSNVKSAVTRCCRDDPDTPYGPEYRVPVHEALKAYTCNAAWQIHREGDLGTIRVGKKGDLVVLDKNPYEEDSVKLDQIGVVESFLQGRANGFASVESIHGTHIKVLVPKE